MLGVGVWLNLGAGYLNITAFEIAAVGTVFVWLILFIRTISAAVDDIPELQRSGSRGQSLRARERAAVRWTRRIIEKCWCWLTMSAMQPLTVADVRLTRLHLFWVKLAYTLVAAGAVVAEVGHLVVSNPVPWLRSPLGSGPYLATGLLFAALMMTDLVWRIPRLALLFSVPVFWIVGYGDIAYPVLWRLMALASAVVSVWWFTRARRATPSGSPVRPPCPESLTDSWARVEPRRGWVWIAGGLVVGVALLVGLQVGLEALKQYEAEAEVAAVEVVALDEETGEGLVIIDGREVPIVEPFRNLPEIGDEVVVLVDRSDLEFVDLVVDVKDFEFVVSMVVGLAATAPLFGASRGLRPVLAARRRRSLALRGAPTRRVRLNPIPGGYRVMAMDGAWPWLTVTDMAGTSPAEDVDRFLESHGFDADDDEFDDDECEDGYEDGEEENDESLPDDVGLAAWADAMKEDFDDVSGGVGIDFAEIEEMDEPLAEASFGPALQGSESFTMLGRWGPDSSVALVRDTGQVWLAELEEPRFRTGIWSALRRGSDGDEDAPIHSTRLIEELSAWGIRNFGWLRWVVHIAAAIPCVWLIPWFISDALGEPDGWVWLFVGLAVVAALLGPPLVLLGGWMERGRSARGMVTYGLITDDVVAPDRFESVAVGRLAVAVRLRDPEDAGAVFPEHVGRDLGPEQAAARIRTWFSEARPGSRSGRRPAPAGILGAALLTLWVVQLLLMLL